MRGFAVLVLVVFWPTAAGASPSCEAEALRIAAEHPKVWRQAGNPTVVCGALPATQRAEVAGYYDAKTTTIYVLDGRFIAHELGHAWFTTQARKRGGIDVTKYARIRGFPNPYAFEVFEDYAETFAWALGEWPEVEAPPPYRFQTVAGAPDAEQINQLRRARLLPR